MATKCEKCGEEMKHDDDGPRLCRWCSQAVDPPEGTSTPAAPAGQEMEE
jgi:hypothetical protein